MSPSTDESRAAALRRVLAAGARRAARVQAAVLLTLVYWLAVGPVAVLARLAGADPLARRRPARTGWIPRPSRPPRETLEGAG
jgi:hypothetical protein